MSCELFVGNLNPEVRIRDLENCFGRYGKIVRCDLKKNFGFIQLADKRDAEEAIRKENNRRLLGSVMTVEWAKGSIGDPSKGRQGGPPGGFRKPRSPNRFGGRAPGGRARSPFGGRLPLPGRDRSPIGRDRGPLPPRSNGFLPRDDKFGGSGRRFGGRDSFDNPRFGGPPRGGDRFPPRDRFDATDRFNDRISNRGPPMNDRGGNRGPPMRDIGFSDRQRSGGDRFNDRRQNLSDRRNFGGPRRF